MGCDIHLYIEYRTKVQKDEYYKRWQSFCGRINPGRDYDLFSKLANVRGEGAIFEPRGLANDMGYEAYDDAYMLITDTSCDCGEGNLCSKQDALRYIKDCGSTYDGDNTNRITHPDWHSHSWLTTKEFKKVLDTIGSEVYYQAVLAAMKEFEKQGYESRVVFWFDN